MDSLSSNIISIFQPFSVLFSKPSWKKALTLLLGAILCTGRRTVCAALRVMGLEKESGFSKYHFLLNRAKWSSLKAAKILLSMLLVFVPSGSPLVLLVDETLERRYGKRIQAKGYYRDAVRSSSSKVVQTTGLKWLVMALSVKLPFMSRALALPFFSVLEPSRKWSETRKPKHKTSLDWTIQMVLQIYRWVGKMYSRRGWRVRCRATCFSLYPLWNYPHFQIENECGSI